MKKNRSPKNSSLISHTSYLKRKTNSRFTLIELLVVVAIIAILAGILMPALTSALRKAKIINCTGNQKSIGLALSMYTSDFKEFFPSCDYHEAFPWRFWHQALLMCGYMGKTFQQGDDAKDNDKRGKNVLICPEDTNPFAVGTNTPKNFLSYGMNAEIAKYEPGDSYNYHYIPRNRLILGSLCGKSSCNKTIKKSPQDIFLVTDSYHRSMVVPSWNLTNIHAYSDDELSDAKIAPRHTTGVPITFVDGHVNFWSFPFHKEALMFESTTKH